jgi:hypothetical protein
MMSDVYLIEVGDRAVGLVARAEDGKSYRFHAAIPRAFGLDGRVFRTPDDAQVAARKALEAKSSPDSHELEDAA